MNWALVRKWAARLVWIPLGAALVLFLFANRQTVVVSLDPFTPEAPSIAAPPLPLWLWLVAFLLAGFFIGAGGMWVSSRPGRRRASAARRELKLMKKEAAAQAPRPAALLGDS